MVLVANQGLSIPSSPFIRKVQVSSGFDVADNYIVQNVQSGDLVITADIPLAALVIDKQGIAINPRGELYSEENIKQKLSLRNFNEELRGAGLKSGGPPKLGKRELEGFANALDRLLAKSRGKGS